mmetsp:Transcript_7223/g.15756  ORF Transcript_7223/g.15756 Transcript_7223/m.15756 type:complete len:303 (-) Transcript_7223:153-1061(-)
MGTSGTHTVDTLRGHDETADGISEGTLPFEDDGFEVADRMLGSSLQSHRLFSSRIGIARSGDETLRRRLAAFALRLRAHAHARGRVGNDAFFRMQTRNQDILWRNPDVARLGNIARRACFKQLRATAAVPSELLEKVLRNTKLTIWVAALDPSERHSWHTHEGALCSGVFYASMPPRASPIVFFDPRGQDWAFLDGVREGAEAFSPDEDRMHDIAQWLPGQMGRPPFIRQRLFIPREGELLVFPPWLGHAVFNGTLREAKSYSPETQKAEAARARAAKPPLRISFAFNLETSMTLVGWGFSV